MENSSLGDRMKEYEALTESHLLPHVPWFLRLDGKAFHTFCRGMKKPFDENFHELMAVTMVECLRECGASVGYTQSDEITLMIYTEDFRSERYFGGRIQKLCSVMAARASIDFTVLANFDKKATEIRPALFDCRAWAVPNKDEAANTFLWREQDAVRNSIQSLGQAHFSHSQLQGLSCKEIQEKLFQERGINWNECEAAQKRGTWIKKGDFFLYPKFGSLSHEDRVKFLFD